MKKIILIILFSFFVSTVMSVPKMNMKGVCYAVEDYMKLNANDPKSVQYIEVGYMLKLNNGSWGQRVKFRAKNQMGAYVIKDWFFQFAGDDIYAKVIAVVPLEEFERARIRGEMVIVAKYDSSGKLIKAY